MINAVQINEYLTVTGQVISEQLKQAVQEGFLSVLNLRSPDELGFKPDEQQMAESLGLHYVNAPLKIEALDEELISTILSKLEEIPKPVVVHCAAGIRSAAMALLSVALEQGLTLEQTIVEAHALGFKYIDYAFINPDLKQLFVKYIDKHAKTSALISQDPSSALLQNFST
ncbi:phosphatase [Phormidium tenue FACHB-886]|nr:phosphatase [Phormidium tenue FACHB-886]